ncbi:MAG: tetratricopeptide repeat protein [Agarilytica sp.]
MRKVKRVTLLLCASVILLVISCSSNEEAADEFYRKGMAYFNQNEFEKARLEYLNALQRNPGLADVYYRLGLIAEREGRVAIVYEMMSKALKLDPRNAKAKIHVAQLMVFGKKFDSALELANEVLENDAENFDGYRIRAAALIGIRRIAQAEEAIEAADKLRPSEASILGLRAIVAREKGDALAAITFLDRAIATGVDTKQYLILRSKIHRDTQKIDALIQDLRALIALDPHESQYVYALAKILARLDKFREAEQVLAAFVEDHPLDFNAKQLLMDTIHLYDAARANRMLNDLLKSYPENGDLKFYQIRSFLKNAKYDAAKFHLNRLSHDASSKKIRLKAGALLAEIFLSEGERQKALALVFENLKENRQHEESLLVKARYDLDNKDYDLAVSSLHTILRNNNLSEKALVLLGTVYVESGSLLLADDSFRQVLEFNPANSEAAMPVVKNLIAHEDLERADNIISRVLDSSPYDPKLLIFYSQIKLLKEEWGAASFIVDRLQMVDNTQAYVALLRGKIAQGRGDCGEAIPYYEKSLFVSPELLPALEALVACSLRGNKESELMLFLSRYKDQFPDSVIGYTATAQVHQSAGRLTEAVSELESALKIKPDWLKGYAKLAGLKRLLGDSVAAISIFKQGIDINPADDYLKVLLAAYYESLGDIALAISLYEEIVRDHSENLVAINNYAVLLMSSAPTEDNLRRALVLSERFKQSEQPMFLDTYGWALINNRRYVEGESVLRRAAEKGPNLVDVQYHFAVALKHLERVQEARVVFKRALKLAEKHSGVAYDIQQELLLLEQSSGALVN